MVASGFFSYIEREIQRRYCHRSNLSPFFEVNILNIIIKKTTVSKNEKKEDDCKQINQKERCIQLKMYNCTGQCQPHLCVSSCNGTAR
ncbi:hypothetical protein AV530_004530 [Patagioenas fasciata monilis]|uniref:Uncharacterized protein n=1 Tax=Patagioenas fasciata monilis TaxID=372326 RepID=A0A1V4J5T3_PATFA|nr:hypothetical protein AV530_004530 [Patagioenas fasciata monilis]